MENRYRHASGTRRASGELGTDITLLQKYRNVFSSSSRWDDDKLWLRFPTMYEKGFPALAYMADYQSLFSIYVLRESQP